MKKLFCNFILVMSIALPGFQLKAQAPANDECSGAIIVALTPFGSSCSTTVGASTSGATRSLPNPSCTSTLNDDDVWYKFTATTEAVVVRVMNAVNIVTGQNTQIGFAMYEQACPSTGTQVYCSNFITAGSSYQVIDGLTPGLEYFMRFWEWTQANFASFEFCVQSVAQPANDECTAAQFISTLPVGTECDSSYHVTTEGATESTPAQPCGNGFNDDDIWFSFTAVTNAVKINFSDAKLLTTASGNANLGFALYESGCPVGGMAVACNPNIGGGSGSAIASGLVPGNNYFLRFFTYGTNVYAAFDFCLVDVNLPANDDCANAVELTVQNGICLSPVAGSLYHATPGAGMGSPACIAPSSSEDVWYKALVPASGSLVVQTSAVSGNVSDLVAEAYTGICGSMVRIACDDDGNSSPYPSDHHPRLEFTGLTPGQMVYIRILGKGTINDGPFAICAWDNSITPPVSDGGTCISGSSISITDSGVNAYRWVPIVDGTGDLVAEVYGDGNNLGVIESSVYVNQSGTIRNNGANFYLDRNLSIEPANNLPARIRYYFKAGEFNALQAVDGTLGSLSELVVTRTETGCLPQFSGPPTGVLPGTVGSYGSDHFIEFTTPSFSSFYLNSGDVLLPLRFLDFTLKQLAGINTLEWKVVKDNELAGFEVQASGDGLNFITIHHVDAAAFIMESADSRTYHFATHDDAGHLLFRIKMLGNDGSVVYSGIIRKASQLPGDRLVSLYPNPTNGVVKVAVTGIAGTFNISVLNAVGSQVLQLNDLQITSSFSIDFSKFPSGVYFIRIADRKTNKGYYGKLVRR